MEHQRREPLEAAILGFLMQGPLHGYDLHRRVEGELGRIWTIGISNLYGALKRLESAGHITCTLTPQENRPPRKVYTLTPAGQRKFLDWVERPVPAMREVRVEFLAKLYFQRMLNLEGAAALIAAQEAMCRERNAWLEQSAAQCAPHDFTRLVFDFRRRQVQAILDWLAACRQEYVRTG
jgi:DNA-binding PadR family transcriptional regulator